MTFVYNKRRRSPGIWLWRRMSPGGVNSSQQPNQPPTVNFSYDATDDPVVDFTDLSSSPYGIVSWLWDFGDSNTSTSQNPTHNFATDNNYNVTLTVTDTNGLSAYYTRTVAITGNIDIPIADFDYTTSDDIEYTFTDTSTGASITGWLWDFDDGNTSTLQNPVHSYAANGNYTVTLIATNIAGNSTPYSEIINVTGHALPTAAFTFDDTADPDIDFTDTSTGGTITAWLWDFGDSNTSTSQNPSHSYTANGTYTVSLTVTNGTGNDDVTHDVVVAGVANPLVANAGSDYTYQLTDYNVVKSYTLNASGSTIPGSSTVTYAWKWNGNTIGTASTKALRLFEGTYDFELTITETNGLLRTSTDTVTVVIKEAPSVLFYRHHFFKPTTNYSDAAASSHFDSWILTKNDESEWSTIAANGSADELHLQYLSFDNLHDPNGDLLDAVGTGAGPTSPNNNNAAWTNGDIPTLRDASWNGTYAAYFLRNPANNAYINKGDQNEYWHVDLLQTNIRDFIQDRVSAWSLANDYIGCWFDNLNTSFKRSTSTFAPTLQYGSTDDETWMNAAIVHLDEMKAKYLLNGPASGILTPLVGGNLQGGLTSDSPIYRWRTMANHLETIMNEFCFLENGGAYKTVARWQYDLEKIRYSLSRGIYFLAVLPFDADAATDTGNGSYTAEHDKMMFCLCSAMLVAGNRLSIRGGGQSSYSFEIDPTEYATFRGYGVPEGDYTYNAGTGYYTREFTKATITVNPTTHAYNVTTKSHTGGFKPYVTQPYQTINTVGETINRRIYATSPQAGDYCTFSMTGAPPGVAIDLNTGIITGTLTSTSQLIYNPVVTATNSIGDTSVTFRWDVKPGAVVYRIQCGGSSVSTNFDAIDEDDATDRTKQWIHNSPYITLNGASGSTAGTAPTAHSSMPLWYPIETIGTYYIFDAAASGYLNFNITGMGTGQKVVILYFDETASTTRTFQVWNGANQLLNAYNIYTAAGNSFDKIVAEKFVVTPVSGTINLEFRAVPTTCRVSAIEIMEYN